MEHQGKLTATVYKQCHEESQKQLKLLEAKEYLGNDTDHKVRYRNLLNTFSTAFKNNGLNLPSSAQFKIWDHDKKKQPFILALFSSTSNARTFEIEAA